MMSNYLVSNDYVITLLKSKNDFNKDEINSILIKQLNYLIQSKIKGFRNSNMYSDLIQEGRIGLLDAIKKFDTNRGINFFKFACWHIKNRIKSYLKWYKKNQKVKLDVTSYVVNFDNYEIQNIITDGIGKLPHKYKIVIIMKFGLYGKCYTFEQIGKELSISKQRVEQIHKIALLKLKNNKKIKQLGDEYESNLFNR